MRDLKFIPKAFRRVTHLEREGFITTATYTHSLKEPSLYSGADSVHLFGGDNLASNSAVVATASCT